MPPPRPYSIALRSTLFALALLVLGQSVAGACVFPLHHLRVICESQVVYETPFRAKIEEANNRALVEQWAATVFDDIVGGQAAACGSEIEEIEAEFKREVTAWALERRISTFYGDDLTIEPYSHKRETETSASENELLACYYNKAEKVENWLFISSYARDYCYDEWPCYHSKSGISWISFLLFQITHPGISTFPYLAIYLPAFIVTTALWYFMVEIVKRHLGKRKLILALLSLCAIYIFLTTPPTSFNAFLEWMLFSATAATFIQLLLPPQSFAQIPPLTQYLRK